MSRLGNKPILIPEKVKVEVQDNFIKAEGPAGKINKILPGRIKIVVSDNQILVKRLSEAKMDKSLHGLTHKLIKNMLEGVLIGFEKKLEVNGLGYRSQMEGSKLVLQVGYSHPVKISIPEGIKIETTKFKNPTKWGLFFWRFKRMFKKMETIQVDIPDEKEFIDALCELDMSPSEYICWALEQYLRMRRV